MHCPRFNSGFHHHQLCIGVELISVIGVLIVGISCTDVTFGKYIMQATSPTTTTNATELIAMTKSFMFSSEEIFEMGHCAITQCKTISCNSIASSDPQIFASSFISTVFQRDCSTMKTIENLIFKNCKFAEGKLKNSWRISDIGIENIRFEDCELYEIDVGAFIAPVFRNSKSLAIINGQITTLKRYVFQELGNLKSLTIHDNILTEVEYDLLNPLVESLQTIELDRSITSLQVLVNITNGTQLSQVQILSLQGNNIPNLSQDIFRSFPNILSLYIDSSKIMKINSNAFTSIRSIQQMFMNNNFIATLPIGLFDTILLHNPNFMLGIADNPWHCDCQLKWIQNMIMKYPKMFLNIPTCRTPVMNIDKSFLNAEFCNEQSVNDSSPQNFTSKVEISTEAQKTTESTDDKFINFACENSKFLQLGNLNKTFFNESGNYKFLIASSWNFSLDQYDNGTVCINTNEYTDMVTILWFRIITNRTGNMRCLKNVRGRILLKHLNEDSTYIFCVLNESHLVTSLFNCSMLKTVALTKKKTWLSDEDKPVVLSIYSISSILFTFLGGVLCFFIIRKHPAMLRGSSRVIMVKRGHVKALIIPKGVTYSHIQRQRINRNKPLTTKIEATNKDYITPIETRKSYLSNIYETICYKINSLENSVKYEPPPLPPHPHHGVVRCDCKQHLSSLSLRIDKQQSRTFDDEPYKIEVDTGIYSCNKQK